MADKQVDRPAPTCYTCWYCLKFIGGETYLRNMLHRGPIHTKCYEMLKNDLKCALSSTATEKTEAGNG